MNGLTDFQRPSDPATLGRTAADLLFKSRLYRLSLDGRDPARLAAAPDDPWPGDARAADTLFRGVFRFADAEVALPNQSPWRVPPPNPGWMAALHGFTWLRDFTASGGATAQRHARALVGGWLEDWADYDPFVWRPDVTGRRLISWIGQAHFLLDDAEPEFRAAALASIARQVRHLARSVSLCPAGAPRITAAAGLVFGAAALPGGRGRLKRGLRALCREVERQVLPDGGHISRNPSAQHQVLRDLIAVRTCLDACRLATPRALRNAIDRMAPMLRFFRHGDGALALFNGGREEDAAAVDLTLAKAEADGRAPLSAPMSGFERLDCGPATLLIDTGPTAAAARGAGHSAPLGFEFSAGAERIIVNCGAPEDADGEWARAAAATAAHSTVTIGERNAIPVHAGHRLGRRDVRYGVRREDSDGQPRVAAAHDAYEASFGLNHRRRVAFGRSGDHLRGRDLLIAVDRGKSEGAPFAARFHLHPEIRAARADDGSAVLLRTPSGETWRFRAGGGVVDLEESVYLGVAGAKRRGEQITVSGRCTGPETVVDWSLDRMPN